MISTSSHIKEVNQCISQKLQDSIKDFGRRCLEFAKRSQRVGWIVLTSFLTHQLFPKWEKFSHRQNMNDFRKHSGWTCAVNDFSTNKLYSKSVMKQKWKWRGSYHIFVSNLECEGTVKNLKVIIRPCWQNVSAVLSFEILISLQPNPIPKSLVKSIKFSLSEVLKLTRCQFPCICNDLYCICCNISPI